MKNKVLTISLLCLLSLTLTACVSKKPNESVPTNSGASESEENLTGNIMDLLKKGKNMKCSFSLDSEGTKSNGQTYIAGGKSRSDFETVMDSGESVESHTIMDGEWMYTWSSAGQQGTKMKFTNFEQKDNDLSDTTQNTGYINKDLSFKCVKWIVDSSKFNVPTNIEFIDMTEMVKQLQEGGAQQFCAMCDQAGTPDDVAECKKNLNCQ